ncbi:MAG TPA: hypothetical protein VKA86_03030 [Candidatus Krumholzibacteria bacterium]|nr:hypothetical protein [Candidatus Krumholzibacteria bacterium]
MRAALRVFAAGFALSIALTGCDRDDSDYRPLELSTDPIVFEDEFGPTIFEPFLTARQDAVTLADVVTFGDSEGAIRIEVDPLSVGPFSGGAFTVPVARDLSGYNALRLQIRASANVSLDLIGFGEGNTGTSLYTASTENVAVTTQWTELILPVPRPSRLRAIRGMMFFSDVAAGSDPAEGYVLWIDQVEWITAGGLSVVGAQIDSKNLQAVFGATVPIGEGRVTFDVDGTTRSMTTAPDYFDYFDAADGDGSVVEFRRGRPVVVGGGEARIRGQLGDVEATGVIQVTGVAPPVDPAPTPNFPPADVISLFSDSYDDITVDTFRAEFGAGTLFELSRDGNAVKAYTGLGTNLQREVAIEFVGEQVDATGFTGLRLDVWLPDAAPEGDRPLIGLKLIDFGPDGEFTPFEDPDRDDSQGFLGLGLEGSGTEITPGEWVTLEIPLTDFEQSPPSIGGALQSRANLAQMLLSVNTGYLFVDNILFFRN